MLSSCLKEEEDYFDKSASARIEEAVKNAISVLEGAENGWAVKYYPNPTQTFGGSTFLQIRRRHGNRQLGDRKRVDDRHQPLFRRAGSGPTLAIDTKTS